MQSTTVGKLAAALCKVQAELPPVKKNSENPFFKSAYADLAGVVRHAAPVLTKYGLAIVQTCQPTEGKVCVETTLLHESGEWISGAMAVTPTKNDPQGYGSAVTYMRRYGYCAIIGLAAEGEDDDGNAATHAEHPGGFDNAKPAPRKPAPAPHVQQHAPPSGHTMEDFLLVDYKEVSSKPGAAKPWTMWFVKFSTDDGQEKEMGTFDRKIADTLDTLKGQVVTVTYQPGRKPGTLEVLSIQPQDVIP